MALILFNFGPGRIRSGYVQDPFEIRSGSVQGPFRIRNFFVGNPPQPRKNAALRRVEGEGMGHQRCYDGWTDGEGRGVRVGVGGRRPEDGA